ncbi:MAG: 4-hydroxy-tetrahydrodipicolinate synthase [Bacteroidia bacterium]
MRNKSFMGTGVAVITPFTKNNEVDHNALEKIIEHLISGGIKYLVALGTTAETPTLSTEEKYQILDTFFKVNNGRLPIAIGAGGNNTPYVVKWIDSLNKYPHSGLLSVTPYYNKPNQSALVHHFGAIANSTNHPIILYNVPSRTGCNMLASTTIELAKKHNNIVCIKEASGDMSQIMAIENESPEDFYIVSGEDALTLAMISTGTKGVISVIAQAYPKEFSQMVEFAMDGDFEKAKNLHYKLLNITNSIYDEGNPVGIKFLMSELGLCEPNVRMPLIPASKTLENKIKSLMI